MGGDNLSSKNYVRELLTSHGLHPKKHFGQNFLTDSHVLSKIIDGADLSPDDTVVEVGPGLGVLTTQLAKKADRVIAVEIDHQLAEILQSTMPTNVEIIRGDILKLDLAGMGVARPDYAHIKVVANLPYYITSAVIFGLLEQALPIKTMVVMVQKEVADRFLAHPGTKAYGLPSLSLAYYGKASLVANVPPHCFFPRPDVHSAVIKLDISPRGDINPVTFFPLIRAAFANRRKTLQNCLAASTELTLTKEDAGALLTSAGLNPNVRGEALGLDDFAKLSNLLQA
ncbi:MAG: 16S rRNA (adenine(1518)-N(6)/adenine(1519)-N(6))-dimethyltransferase RsmA [Defluviitaleaceae bacterium]|nr:16S rRNA (adenine(1518)-N(6)/adenine(1519)-N(6))-dimethyltransferase RsmA [Defluviitaleaceae bacterium]